MTVNRPFSLVLLVAAAALAVRAETWFWVGQTPTTDAEGNERYLYVTSANWTNATGRAGVPQTGDAAVLGLDSAGKTPYAFSTTSTDGAYALESIWYPGPCARSINQGNFKLQTGGRGLQYLVNRDSGANWAGIVLVGSGEGIVNVSNKVDLSMQMRIAVSSKGGSPTLVKEGLGRLICFNQNRDEYSVPLTKIRRGTLNVTPKSALAKRLEFRFDSAADDLRLEVGEPGKYDLVLRDALVSESPEAVGTDHGFMSPNGCAIRFTGTPKANPMTFSGKVYDSCGLGWEPDGADATLVLSRGVSTTTGAVSVARGTVRLTDGATFASLGELRLGTNATFAVDSGAGASFKADALVLTDKTSTLRLGAGVELEVGSLTLPDGTSLPRGVYGATAVFGSTRVGWIKGDGFLGVGGAMPKHAADAYLKADGWYEFGNPGWTYSSSASKTWFETMPEVDLRRLYFPPGAKVRFVGGILLRSFAEGVSTFDWSPCTGIGVTEPTGLGSLALTVPAGTRFWFRAPTLGRGNVLSSDIALDGTWQLDDTARSMVHAGRFSGTGKLSLFNFYRTFTQTGAWAFAGTVDQQQVGNDVIVNSTSVSGKVSKWLLRGGSATYTNPIRLVCAPRTATALSVEDLEMQGAGGLTDSGTRYGPAICVCSNASMSVAKLKTPRNLPTNALHLCANPTLGAADRAPGGHGRLEVGSVTKASYFYVYPDVDLTVGSVAGATTFDYSAAAGVVNCGSFVLKGKAAAGTKLLARSPQLLPKTVAGLAGATELVGGKWSLVLDFDDLENCRRTVGADWTYPDAGTIEVTWTAGTPAPGRYLLLAFPSGSALSDASRWPARLASGRSSRLALERTASELYVCIGEDAAEAVFYVDSERGSDSASGVTPQTAFKTLAKVNAADVWPGDKVLFRRGGLWRGQLVPKSGETGRPVYYGAYGEGVKPILENSVAAEAPGSWEATDRPNVWRTTATFALDVGSVIFNHGEAWGWKVYKQDDVNALNPHRYLYDRTDKKVYLYSAGDPAAKWNSIELALNQHVVSEGSRHDVVYDGLWVRYGAAHGFGGGSVRGIVIRNCDVSWIGGGVQKWTDNGDGTETPTRFGNGIEFWDNARDCVVESNRLWEIYDAALTTQGHGDGIVESNVVYRYNVIWNAEYSFEMWTNPQTHEKPSLCMDLYITNNTACNAGGCWSHAQRPNGPNGSHLMFYGHSAPTTNFVIRNNVFCNATEWHSRISTDAHALVTIDHNLVWSGGSPFCYNAKQGYLPYVDFARYQADLGWDATSVNAEPKFADAEAHDFRLLSSSPGAHMGPGGSPVGACPLAPRNFYLLYR